MIDDDLHPLADDMQRLLMSERAAPSIPKVMQDRIAARLAATIAIAPVPPEASLDPGQAPGPDALGAGTGAAGAGAGASQLSPLASLAAKPLLLASLAFGVGTGAGVAGTVLLRANPPGQAPAIVGQVEMDGGVSEPPAPDAMIVPEELDAGSEPLPAMARPLVTKPSEPPVARDKALAAERALLELSRTAITRGDAATALQELTRHKQDYRNGRLVEERDALWVQALVLAGSHDKARAKAEAFKTRYPSSLFLPVMNQVLAESQ